MGKKELKSKSAARENSFSGWGRRVPWVLAICILIIYGRTITYEFTLDDDLIIVNNPVVPKGFSGIAETFTHGSVEYFKGGNFQIYRPALISFFCIEHQIFGMTPGGFHFFNIILYFLICLVIYKLLLRLFPEWHLLFAFAIVLLYVVHPVHTEVVASAKSQDELLSTLGSLSALLFFMKYADAKVRNISYLILSLLLMLLSLFSKESSFAFLAIFPMVLFVVRKKSFKESALKPLPLYLAGFFFLLCRYFAIRETNVEHETSAMENILYGAKSTGELIGSKLAIAFQYLKMMVWPHPMSWDYSFNQIPVQAVSDFVPLVSIILFLSLIGAGIYFIRSKPEVSFGIAFFIVLILPTASIFFPNGTTFADRFLFLPSLGFLMALVFFIARAFGSQAADASKVVKVGFLIPFFSICLLMSVAAINRTSDWKDDYSVFTSGARNAPNSSRTNEGVATMYMNMAQESMNPKERSIYVDSSILFFEKSLDKFPGNNSAAYKLGLIYAMSGNSEKAFRYYRQSIYFKPDYLQALNNIGALFASAGNFDSAYYYFDRALKSQPLDDMALTNICIASYNLGRYDQVIAYGEKAVANSLGNSKIYNVLQQSYIQKGNVANAEKYQRLLQVSPR